MLVSGAVMFMLDQEFNVTIFRRIELWEQPETNEAKEERYRNKAKEHFFLPLHKNKIITVHSSYA